MTFNTIKGRFSIALLALMLVGLLAFAGIAGCSGEEEVEDVEEVEQATEVAEVEEEEVEKVQVVTTTNFVADWVENVGGDGVEVFSLVPTGADPHGFQPGARDVARIADADLVFSVGLGLEGEWLHELLENAARDESSIIEVTDAIEPIEFAETHREEVELLEHIGEAIHEVEEGELTAEEAFAEIKALIAEFEEAEEGHGEEDGEDEDHAEEEEEEGEDHGEEEEGEDEDHDEGEEEEGEDHGEEEDHAEEEEVAEMVLAIIAQAESGAMDTEEAIEEIEHLVSGEEEGHDDHGHGVEDPHFWFDPLRVKLAVDLIAEHLSTQNPAGANDYWSNATAYKAQLDELDSWTQEQVSAVPDSNRLLLTSHDSFGYFAVRYGFEVIGVILGTTTEVEPSAEHMAELTETVEKYKVPAVFGETTVSERLATALAAESGAELVRLYSGSLGAEGSGAETYLDMVRANVERIVGALK